MRFRTRGTRRSRNSRANLHASGGAVRVERKWVAQRAVAPKPTAAVPVQIPDTQETGEATVDGAPEKDGLALPVLGDEFRVSQEVVKDVGVEDGPGHKLHSKVGPHDKFVILLFLGQIEFHHDGRAPDEDTTLTVLLYAPIVRNEWGRITVDGTLEIATEVATVHEGLLYAETQICQVLLLVQQILV